MQQSFRITSTELCVPDLLALWFGLGLPVRLQLLAQSRISRHLSGYGWHNMVIRGLLSMLELRILPLCRSLLHLLLIYPLYLFLLYPACLFLLYPLCLLLLCPSCLLTLLHPMNLFTLYLFTLCSSKRPLFVLQSYLLLH